MRLFLILVVIAISCQSKIKKNGKEKGETNTEITRVSVSGDSLSEKTYSKLALLTGIDNLNSGFQGEQIKFWFEGLSQHWKIISLKKQDNSWKYNSYEFDILANSEFEVVSINNIVQKSGAPISDWEIFLNKIKSYNIYGLKDYREITNYEACGGDEGLTVRIIHKDMYNQYLFPCLDVQPDNITMASDLKKIINYMREEFK